MFPETAAVLGPISVISAWVSGNQVANQITAINSELVTIQGDINSLQSQISNLNSMYTAFVAQQTGNNACGALRYFDTALGSIYAANSNQLSSSTPCGSGFSNPSPSIALGNVFFNNVGSDVNASALNNMSKFINLANTNVGSFIGSVNSISATEQNTSYANTTLGSSGNGTIYQLVQNTNPKSGSECAPSKGSSLTSILTCGYQYFVDNMLPTPATQSLTNVVNSINDYNNMLFNTFQQSLSTLQYAYNIEAQSNYMNYVAYVACLNKGSSPVACSATEMQIPSWENIQAITFSVTNGSAASGQISSSAVPNVTMAGQYLTVAQQNLAMVYAARINALYKNIMSFIISDPMVSSQSYSAPSVSSIPINGVTIDLPQQGKLYSTISTSKLNSSVSAGSIPSSGIISSGGAFYQYNGINQLYPCVNTILQTLQNPNGPIPIINLSNCTSVFPDSNASKYDGVNMSAYGFSGDLPDNQLLLTNTLDMNNYCSPASLVPFAPQLFNYKTAGVNDSVIICGTWGGPNLFNSQSLAQNVIPGSISQQPLGAWFAVTTNESNSYIFNNDKNLDFTFIASSGGSSNGGSYSYESGNFYRNNNAQDNYPWITDGGFGGDKSETPTHTAFVQVNLPNGYIMPLYIFVAPNVGLSLVGNPTYASLICPSTFNPSLSLPGLASCTQNWNTSGSISLKTTDGQSYTISIVKLSSGQGGSYGGNLTISQP